MSVVAEAKNELHMFERVAMLSHIEKQDAEIARLRSWIENVATDSQLDQPVPALGGMTGRQL